MKKFHIIILAAFIACNTSGKEENSKQDTLSTLSENAPAGTAKPATIDGAWQLQPVLAADTVTGKIPTLVFDLNSKKFQGNTGCNNMSGNFLTSGDSLSFNEQIIMTKMACPGYNEQSFIQSLTNTNRYKIEKGVLQLMQQQTILSRWVRKDSTIQKKI